MKKIMMFIVMLAGVFCSPSFSQIKYGYAVLHLRCGNEDGERNKVYYSPIIELDRLNFDKYTEGVGPAFVKYSVGYYKYAIAKWFEIFLKDHYHILINDREKYERNGTSVVFDDKKNDDCSNDKTNAGCFFTDKQKLIILRNNAISESKLPKYENEICEVISL